MFTLVTINDSLIQIKDFSSQEEAVAFGESWSKENGGDLRWNVVKKGEVHLDFDKPEGDFAHVNDPWMREFLSKPWDGDEDSICKALNFTDSSLRLDATNEEVPYAVYLLRARYAQEASDWWNEEGAGFDAQDSLRLFWSV